MQGMVILSKVNNSAIRFITCISFIPRQYWCDVEEKKYVRGKSQ